MVKRRIIKTREAAIENVKRFFSNSPDVDSISIEEAFVAWGRPDPENAQAHKAWLSNMLFHLKYHNLVTPIYSFDSGRKRLTELQLTLEGKKSLGRIESANEPRNGERTVSLGEVMKAIPKIKKENPDFNITFSVTPK